MNMSTQNIEKEQTSTRKPIFTVSMVVFLIVMAGYFALIVMAGYFVWTLNGDKVSTPWQLEYFITDCKVNDGGSIICAHEV